MLYKFIFKNYFIYIFIVVEPCPQNNTTNGIALMSKDRAPSPTICLEYVGVIKSPIPCQKLNNSFLMSKTQ